MVQIPEDRVYNPKRDVLGIPNKFLVSNKSHSGLTAILIRSDLFMLAEVLYDHIV